MITYTYSAYPFTFISFLTLYFVGILTFIAPFAAGLTPCLLERLNAEGYTGFTLPGRFSPECDSDGKYEPLQCDPFSNICWCVGSQGQEIPETRGRGRRQCVVTG